MKVLETLFKEVIGETFSVVYLERAGIEMGFLTYNEVRNSVVWKGGD